MKRFMTEKPKRSSKNLLLSILLFALVLVLFYSGTSSMTEKTTSEQKKTLEHALQRAAVYCYSIEGTYPESLDYLEDAYGITYDKTKFFVDYQVLGSNLMPDITVIER